MPVEAVAACRSSRASRILGCALLAGDSDAPTDDITMYEYSVSSSCPATVEATEKCTQHIHACTQGLVLSARESLERDRPRFTLAAVPVLFTHAITGIVTTASKIDLRSYGTVRFTQQTITIGSKLSVCINNLL